MSEVPPPPPPPGAATGPPVRPPGAPPPAPRSGASSDVPPPPIGSTGAVSATGAPRPGGANRGLIIGIVAAIVAVLGLGVILVVTDDDDDDAGGPDPTTEITSEPDGTGASGDIPEAPEEPDGLGDDSELDGLAENCFDGQMEACDDLFVAADTGTDYRRYGDTCAGRQDELTGVLCTDAFPG